MSWKFDEKSPIYTQIAQHLKLQIIGQQIKCGEKLPAVRELAEKIGVNPNTIQRAFSELEKEGIVYTSSTSGRFVTEDRHLIQTKQHDIAQSEVELFVHRMEQLGFQHNEITAILEKYMKENH